MKIFNKAMIAACLFTAAHAASATPFKITDADLDIGSGYGYDICELASINCHGLLDVRFDEDFSTQTFNLMNVGDSKTFKVADVKFKEDDLFKYFLWYSTWKSGIENNETNNLDVALDLTFTAPGAIVNTLTTVGVATVGKISDDAVDYSLTWNPLEVAFGNGGLYEISLNSLNFNGTNDHGHLNATVTLKRGEVPEPGSLALLGLGMLGAGVIRRRRTAK